MRVIRLKGEIGWDISAESIEQELLAAGGGDIIVEVASPGGHVFEGIEIFNLIANYEGSVTVRITGIVASMASYIVLAADKVEAADNAVYMLHNPTTLGYGDYRDFAKISAFLDKMAELLSKKYQKKTGRDDIRALMDKETWLYGEEIVEAGFADSIFENKRDMRSKEKDLIFAQENVKATLARVRTSYASGLAAVAAKTITKIPDASEEEEKIMTLEELKVKYPKLYNELAEKSVAEERSRVNAHLNFYVKGIAQGHAIQAIREGKALNDEETAFYIAEATSGRDVEKLVAATNPDPISTAVVDEDEDNIGVEDIMKLSRY